MKGFNEYIVRGNEVDIIVPYKEEKFVCKIDLADLELVMSVGHSFVGIYDRLRITIYAVARVPDGTRYGTTICMHRLIMGVEGYLLDHINGDGLDNRRYNLRKSNKELNGLNRHTISLLNTSGYTGVYFDKSKGKFRGKLKYKGKQIFVGCFTDPYEAHLAIEKRRQEILNAQTLLLQ